MKHFHIESIYDAWRQVGCDIFGADWENFVAKLHEVEGLRLHEAHNKKPSCEGFCCGSRLPHNEGE